MKYRAKYISDNDYNTAVSAAISAIKSDTYYAKYHGGGTGITYCSSWGGTWGDVGANAGPLAPEGYVVPRLELLDEEFIKTHTEVKWISCSGNMAGFEFNHEDKEVIVVVDSARQGIPKIVHDFFGRKAAEILIYDTAEPTWAWWENLKTKKKNTDYKSTHKEIYDEDKYEKMAENAGYKL